MKKFITILVSAILATAAGSAQIYTSDSRMVTHVKKEKAHYGHNWFVKAGGGCSKPLTNYDADIDFVYNAAFGYQKQISAPGFYWGAQIGITSAHEYYDHVTYSSSFAYLGPTFGIKRKVATGIDLDIHLGTAAGIRVINDKGADAGYGYFLGELGGGVWLNRWFVGLDVRWTDDSRGYTNNIQGVVNLGLKF